MIYKLILVSLLATSAAFASPTKGARDELATKGERYLSSPAEYQRQRQTQQAEVSKTTRDEPFQQEQQREYSKTVVQQEQQRELSKTQERDEQRREPSKTSAAAPADTEQRREEQVQLSQYPEQQKVAEEYQQQREEAPLTQVKEEAPAPAPTKTLRYEARPQVVEEASYKETSYKEAAKGQKFEFQKVEAQREEGLKTSKLAEPIRQEQQKTIEEPKAVAYEQQRETYYEQQQQQQQQQVELKEYDQQRRLEDQQAQYTQVQYQQQEERAYGVKGAAASAAAQVAEPEPYAFDYSVEGSSRRESGDTNGVVRGQYTLQNPDGSSRIVDYVADRDGFRASVNTNEFGTESGSPANVELRSSQPAAQDISLRLEGKTREFLNPPVPAQAPVAAVKGAAPVSPPKPDNWSVKGGQQQQVAYIEEIRNTKGAAPAAPVQQQQQQVYYVEEVRATKSAAKSEQRYEQVKAPAQPLERAPAKGTVQRSESIESTPVEAPVAAPAVVKSAELRTPKAIAAEIKQAAAIPVPVAPVAAAPRVRAGFESATAHRPIIAAPRNQVVHPSTIQYVSGSSVSHPQHRHISPSQAGIVRHYHQPGQAPSVRGQYNPRPQPVASVLRSQLQHDRYPPNPIYNYNTRGERPLNPRVSFYSNNAETNEETPIGFGDAS